MDTSVFFGVSRPTACLIGFWGPSTHLIDWRVFRRVLRRRQAVFDAAASNENGIGGTYHWHSGAQVQSRKNFLKDRIWR